MNQLKDDVPLIAHEISFTSVNEPTLNIRCGKLKFSASCLKLLAETDYIQIAIYPMSKRLCAIPAAADDKDAIRWSSYTAKRRAKEINAHDFLKKLYALMSWHDDYRYKVIGKLTTDIDEKKIIVFDLSDAIIYKPTGSGCIIQLHDSIGTPGNEHVASLVTRFECDAEINICRGIENEQKL